MGRFPKRSGVDAKLSEGSLFDLLLPIYKHECSGEKDREKESRRGSSRGGRANTATGVGGEAEEREGGDGG